MSATDPAAPAGARAVEIEARDSRTPQRPRHRAVDLLATLRDRQREPVECLRDPADLDRWLAVAGLAVETPATGSDLGGGRQSARLHVYERLEETWYVLDGELAFGVGDETFHATAGASVFVPPRLPHAFANRSEAPAKFLPMISPAGHDRCFEELAEILAADGPPDGRIERREREERVLQQRREHIERCGPRVDRRTIFRSGAERFTFSVCASVL